jgi:hypothetical protein
MLLLVNAAASALHYIIINNNFSLLFSCIIQDGWKKLNEQRRRKLDKFDYVLILKQTHTCEAHFLTIKQQWLVGSIFSSQD